ncbi:MAG: aminopeptidase P family protein [Alphaproteobacteria bacterium]|nr:aminopeptidase P family protein [Alphaproteobacteria bacterium]
MSAEPALSFSRAEYDRRVAAVRDVMRARGVDLLVLDECEALDYLFGTANTLNLYRAGILPLEGEPVMMPRQLDEAPFREASWLTEFRPFADWKDPVEHVCAVIAERGFAKATIGMDYNSYAMGVRRFGQYQTLLSGARIVDFGNAINEIRLIKSAEEIDYLRRASTIADEAMRIAIAAVGVGGTERDAATAASGAFVRLGADNGACGPITAGVGAGFLHGHLHDRPLVAHDVVHMELTPRINGYSARLMRPAVVGGATARQQGAAEKLIELQDAQIAAMKPGADARAVDAILREGILKSGLRDRFDNLTGYTLGFYHRAGPRTSDFTRVFGPHVDYRLAAGMTFHMWVAADGLAFSETVLVGAGGPERLTKIERKLFVR